MTSSTLVVCGFAIPDCNTTFISATEDVGHVFIPFSASRAADMGLILIFQEHLTNITEASSE